MSFNLGLIPYSLNLFILWQFAKQAQFSIDSSPSRNSATPDALKMHSKLSKALALSIAYAANTGGIATLTGSPPNLVFKAVIDE